MHTALRLAKMFLGSDKTVRLEERTGEPFGVTDRAYLFTRDSGGGKTQLCVKFPSGVVQILATEP